MIKDIGIQGLAAGTVTFVGADKVNRVDCYENTYKFKRHKPFLLDFVDVSTMGDTERIYLECYTESTGPR